MFLKINDSSAELCVRLRKSSQRHTHKVTKQPSFYCTRKALFTTTVLSTNPQNYLRIFRIFPHFILPHFGKFPVITLTITHVIGETHVRARHVQVKIGLLAGDSDVLPGGVGGKFASHLPHALVHDAAALLS